MLGQLVQLATKYDDEVAAAAAAAAAAMGPQLPDVMYLEATGNIPLVIGIPLGGFKRPSCADDDLPVRTPIKLSTDCPYPIKLSADRHVPPLLLHTGGACGQGDCRCGYDRHGGAGKETRLFAPFVLKR